MLFMQPNSFKPRTHWDQDMNMIEATYADASSELEGSFKKHFKSSLDGICGQGYAQLVAKIFPD
jgi:hypothetical protein